MILIHLLPCEQRRALCVDGEALGPAKQPLVRGRDLLGWPGDRSGRDRTRVKLKAGTGSAGLAVLRGPRHDRGAIGEHRDPRAKSAPFADADARLRSQLSAVRPRAHEHPTRVTPVRGLHPRELSISLGVRLHVERPPRVVRSKRNLAGYVAGRVPDPCRRSADRGDDSPALLPTDDRVPVRRHLQLRINRRNAWRGEGPNLAHHAGR